MYRIEDYHDQLFYFFSYSLITKWEHKILFGNVMKIQKCSDRFLEDLKSEWKNSIFLDGLCEVVREHAKNHFQVYIKYCSNMVDQGSTLKLLRYLLLKI